MFLINVALDVVGAVVKPFAAKKRLERAIERFGGDLVEVEIGSQNFIMPRKVYDILAKSGLLQELILAAQRDQDVQALKEAA